MKWHSGERSGLSGDLRFARAKSRLRLSRRRERRRLVTCDDLAPRRYLTGNRVDEDILL